VTPYYNKASDDGLLLHYQAIAKAATKPLIVYNVPSRTGVSLQMKHYRELAKIDGIVGVKEASGNLSLLEELCAVCNNVKNTSILTKDVV
jgi:4-hydroxy-tetrahydrodipicolinate synthase